MIILYPPPSPPLLPRPSSLSMSSPWPSLQPLPSPQSLIVTTFSINDDDNNDDDHHGQTSDNSDDDSDNNNDDDGDANGHGDG